MKADEKKCPACAETIKAEAAVCKHCGHRFSEEEVASAKARLGQSKRIGCGVAIVAVLLVGYCVSRVPVPAGNTVATANTAGAESGAAAAPGSKWSYSEQTDKMRGRTDQFASLDSDNQADFDFPYNGGATLAVQLQKYKSANTEVLLRISKGQFVCHSFTGGTVQVKFDNGPLKRFACSDTSDGDTSVIFLRPAGAFIAALKASKTLMVEAEFFQAGSRQFTFTSAGLQWK